MKTDTREETRNEKLDDQRAEINRVLEIDPEVLREIHGGAGCDCCKWEAALA